MPSIFIWKSTEENTSKTTIKYYSGSNWALEENDMTSRSMLFDSQYTVSDSVLSDTVIVFSAKLMNKDWVGTELLEVTQLPYKLIKSDDFGTLDMIGGWFRFTSANVDTNVEEIHKWIENDSKLPVSSTQLNFDNFLIKYDTTNLTVPTYSANKHNKYRHNYPTNKNNFKRRYTHAITTK